MMPPTAATSVVPSLAAGLQAMGLPADEAIQHSLSAYLDLLARWNGVYNLTAIRDPERMRVAHLFDSLSVLPSLRASLPADRSLSPHLMDIGTGAGLPGLPLALAWPELRVTLVEPVGKKVAFLRQAVGALELRARVDVQACRVEQLSALQPAPDLIVSRAFASLADFVRGIERVAGPDTRVFAMKGQVPSEEIASLPPGWQVLACEPIAVPGLDAQRHLLCLARRDDARQPGLPDSPQPDAGPPAAGR